ncbi:hypothetical protein [Methylicorpusculum sp.]|uniref:hypothetical protein n=1 Tax=Methylicorpusculum sp. TaxID=2713644 RepID=UPI002AB9B16A|nr:hypothetical protein [Methylicorpusculum sp.]MDZ4151089.1 hypothetical protein [Methylicorpusculum sp.]
MNQYTLNQGLYLYPTPAGAYATVSTKEADRARQFLRNLLLQRQTPELTGEILAQLMKLDEDAKCLELLYHCQKLGWIQGLAEPLTYPDGAVEDIVPGFLGPLSEKGKVLLADQQGFYLATQGFPHEVAEELSALSAEIATVHERRSGLLLNNMGLGSHAWSVVDSFGNSQVGFWPLFIGNNRFVVAVSGIPHFNQPEFVSLVWALTIRYAA